MGRQMYVLALITALLISNINAFSQENRLTREQILAMSTEQLNNLPLEDLMYAVELLGVSNVDELFALIMNKNVSSASKEEEQSFTSPLSSTVITREEMRTYGISTIEEAFRLIPGMIVSEKYNGIYDVQMRGLNNIPDNNLLYYTDNMNVLLMIDGRISHNYGMGSPILEFLPISIEDVERIEVVRGATSALYGPNAVNGVINIITSKPDQSSAMVEGSIQIGNNTKVADFAFRQALNDKWAIGISANAQVRERPTDDVYLLPNSIGIYHVNDAATMAGTQYFTVEAIGQLLQSGVLTDYSAGRFISLKEYEELVSFANVSGTEYYFAYPTKSADNVPSESWKDPRISRRTFGYNGYVTFNPKENIRFDLTGGYQDAYVQNTSVGNDDNAPRGRTAQSWYTTLNAEVGGLKFAGDFASGDYDYIVGGRGFRMERADVAQFQAEYNINIGGLQIRPNVSYQTIYYVGKPDYFDYGDGKGPTELSTFFGFKSKGNYTAYYYDFAPSLRLDYKVGNARIIGAFREDKTRFPDKWNPSWQFSASYQINENNFIRLVNGRSFRSAAFANTNASYIWPRIDRGMPAEMQYLGNTESPLVHIDNFELGYRWRPVNSVLLDAEIFYSRSKDYGALKSYASMLTMNFDEGTQMVSGLTEQYLTGQITDEQALAIVTQGISSKTQLRYDEMPFKVSQYGLSFNLDWIISNNLIAKVNANFQRTTIDNYYQYSQGNMIEQQLMASYETTQQVLPQLMVEIETNALMSGNPAQYMATMFSSHTNTEPFRQEYAERGDAMLVELMNAYNNNQSYKGCNNPLGLYYMLKYNIEYDRATDEYNLGGTVAENPVLTDGHKHKVTPDFYGMFGLIYKPVNKLTISTFGNYQGKREYTSNYGVTEVDPVFTMNLKLGYEPVKGCEVFFNAHNLFNSEKQEFIYTDKVEGIYSVGVNFSF